MIRLPPIGTGACWYCAENSIDPIAAFSHLRRALKPSGRVVLLCPRTAAENRYISEATQAARPLLPPGAMPPVSPDEPGMFSFADPARVRRILEGAGLHDVALLPLDRPMRLGGPGGASDAAAFSMQFGPLPRILAAAGPQLHDVVLAATVERYRALETADGVTLAGAFWIVTARR